MNLQIRIEVPADGTSYSTPTTVQVIEDAETVRAVMAAILFTEASAAQRAEKEAEFAQAEKAMAGLTDLARAAQGSPDEDVEIDFDLGS